jgi:hypothetical protein
MRIGGIFFDDPNIQRSIAVCPVEMYASGNFYEIWKIPSSVNFSNRMHLPHDKILNRFFLVMRCVVTTEICLNPLGPADSDLIPM